MVRARRFCGLFVLLLLSAASLLRVPAGAAELSGENIDEMDSFSQISGEYSEMLDSIPEEVAELLPEGFYSEDAEEAADAVDKMNSPSYILKSVFSLLGANMGQALKLLAQILGLLIICALFGVLKNLFPSEALSGALTLCSTLGVAGVIVSSQQTFITMVINFVDKLNIFAAGMSPVMCALYALGGNVRSAVVSNGALLIFLNVCELFCGNSVLVVAGICMAMAFVTAVAPGVNLKSLGNAVKKTYTFSLGFVMLLLSFTLSSRTVLSARADSLAARSVKFIAGAFIPVVGGSVGDSLRAVGGSVDFIKATVGVGGIVIVVLLLLPTLVSLLMARMTFIFGAAAAEILGCEREGKLLGEMGSIYGYLCAVVSICSVTFILALNVFVHCTAAIGG